MNIGGGSPISSKGRRFVWLARGAFIGQVLFTSGWLLGGLVQEPAYSPARHDISELGAITARAPWVMLVPQGLGGALTIAFVIGALRPTLKVPWPSGPRSAPGLSPSRSLAWTTLPTQSSGCPAGRSTQDAREQS